MPSGRVDFLPLAGTDVGNPLAGYLNGINSRPFQAAPDNSGGGGGGSDPASLQGSPTSPFTPPLLPIVSKPDEKPDEPAPAPVGPKPGKGTKAPINPWDHGPGSGPTHGGTTTVPTRYDGQRQQGPNRDLLSFLQFLASLQQRQRGQHRLPPGYQRPGHGASQNRSGTPMADAARAWIFNNFFGRGAGYTGANDTPGGGNVFGGFYRSQGPDDPGQGTGHIYGVGPNVGYTGFMRGGLPSQTRGGNESLNIMTGRGDNSMERWLADFFRSAAQPYEHGSNWPFGIPGEAEGHPARGPGYDRQYQQDWRDFFNRGSSLENMDASFRGEYGGGGGMGNYMLLV